MKPIYLDNAATTPIDKEVIKRVTEVMSDVYGNPSSVHQFGRKAKTVVEEARKSIAKHFNVTTSEIVFTAGGSEADNLILRNAIVNLGVRRIISSKIEHHAVLHTILALEKEFDITVNYVNLANKGEVDYKHLEELLEQGSEKTLVSLMYINNELGNLLDLKKVCTLCTTYNALFHSDTVQAIGHYVIDLQKTPIDFMVASGHKFHGPKGVGFAIVKKGFGIQPQLIGGEQERGARAGTENVPNIAGMHKALEIAMQNLEVDQKYISGLKKYFSSQLLENITDISFNGCSEDLVQSTYTILNVRFAKDYPMLLFQLDLKGIAASGGSACQSGSNKGSHVLNEILSKNEANHTSVRFSFSKYTTKKELDRTVEVLKGLV
ncbi:MAG TPA: cysteine desulfurase [Flavobacteriaceae bacterium]|jgi:cysteine desulfurase|nr:cysteine desulfurase [Flavobacteriaceae bacterium]HBS11404.1 cysteine desulfurase [Flavobacteriaceae bacterium]